MKNIKNTVKRTKTFFQNSFLKFFSAADDEDVVTINSPYVTIVNEKLKNVRK